MFVLQIKINDFIRFSPIIGILIFFSSSLHTCLASFYLPLTWAYFWAITKHIFVLWRPEYVACLAFSVLFGLCQQENMLDKALDTLGSSFHFWSKGVCYTNSPKFSDFNGLTNTCVHKIYTFILYCIFFFMNLFNEAVRKNSFLLLSLLTMFPA